MDEMKINRTKLTWWSVVLLSAGLAIAIFPGLIARTSDCGGNSAALVVCREYANTLRLLLSDKTKRLAVLELAPTNKTNLFIAAQSHWIPDASFLIKTNIDFTNPGNDLVIVCMQPYENLPQPNLWNGYRNTWAHAVGFLSGESRLMSPEEFGRLDTSQCVAVSKLIEHH